VTFPEQLKQLMPPSANRTMQLPYQTAVLRTLTTATLLLGLLLLSSTSQAQETD
jgi:hypothetical protein